MVVMAKLLHCSPNMMATLGLGAGLLFRFLVISMTQEMKQHGPGTGTGTGCLKSLSSVPAGAPASARSGAPVSISPSCAPASAPAGAPGHGDEAEGTTRVGFYSTSCPIAESLVQDMVRERFAREPTIAPALLRMQFHDCFVRGCDGSILLDGPGTEKTAPPNLLLRGFDLIEEAKARIESVCPGTVSCADIIALAARDSVVLTNGPSWDVPTGRRDGRVSLASEVSDIPSFRDPVPVQIQKFATKGLSAFDMVTLVGGHTIGTVACQFFQYRLYNFTGSGNESDPTIDPAFLQKLQMLCPPQGDGFRRVSLDDGSSGRFDTSYYRNLKAGKGVLESDQRIWVDDPSTRRVIDGFLEDEHGNENFNDAFGSAMIKMGNIDVLTGHEGEIRRVCSRVESRVN